MIRPRVGDFFYSKEDVGVMLEDIRMFKNFGHVRGFVVGALTRDGRVDVERMRLYVYYLRLAQFLTAQHLLQVC